MIFERMLLQIDLTATAKWSSFIIGCFTFLFAIYNFSQSIVQRRKELRWKQASVAREIIREMHQHEKTNAAVEMMDWFSGDRIYKYKGKESTITYDEVLIALPKVREQKPPDKDQYILECFDWFFYYIDRLEQNIRSELILFVDVKPVFRHYCTTIYENKEIYNDFMSVRGYTLSQDFWRRFESTSL